MQINLIGEKMIATNKIEKLYIKNDILFLEGLAYIKGINSPDHTSLAKYLKLSNAQTEFHQEYPLGMVPKKHLSKELYKGKYYNYTAAGTATVGFKGIDLRSLDYGMYEITLSVTQDKSQRHYIDLSLAFSQFDDRSLGEYCEYRLFQSNGKTFLCKRDIWGRAVNEDYYLSIDKKWTKDTLFHIEGAFVIPGVDMYEFRQGTYYLIAKKPITQKQYVFELGQIKKSGLGLKIDNPYGAYNACYYATLGLKGIETRGFELGNYDLYISLGYKSEMFTVKTDLQLEISDESCALIVKS